MSEYEAEAGGRCGCPQPFGPKNTDIRCHVCGEMVNVRCWNCRTPRGEGPCPNPRRLSRPGAGMSRTWSGINTDGCRAMAADPDEGAVRWALRCACDDVDELRATVARLEGLLDWVRQTAADGNTELDPNLAAALGANAPCERAPMPRVPLTGADHIANIEAAYAAPTIGGHDAD